MFKKMDSNQSKLHQGRYINIIKIKYSINPTLQEHQQTKSCHNKVGPDSIADDPVRRGTIRCR